MSRAELEIKALKARNEAFRKSQAHLASLAPHLWTPTRVMEGDQPDNPSLDKLNKGKIANLKIISDNLKKGQELSYEIYTQRKDNGVTYRGQRFENDISAFLLSQRIAELLKASPSINNEPRLRQLVMAQRNISEAREMMNRIGRLLSDKIGIDAIIKTLDPHGVYSHAVRVEMDPVVVQTAIDNLKAKFNSVDISNLIDELERILGKTNSLYDLLTTLLLLSSDVSVKRYLQEAREKRGVSEVIRDIEAKARAEGDRELLEKIASNTSILAGTDYEPVVPGAIDQLIQDIDTKFNSDSVNKRISGRPVLDASGNPVLDAGGQPERTGGLVRKLGYTEGLRKILDLILNASDETEAKRLARRAEEDNGSNSIIDRMGDRELKKDVKTMKKLLQEDIPRKMDELLSLQAELKPLLQTSQQSAKNSDELLRKIDDLGRIVEQVGIEVKNKEAVNSIDFGNKMEEILNQLKNMDPNILKTGQVPGAQGVSQPLTGPGTVEGSNAERMIQLLEHIYAEQVMLKDAILEGRAPPPGVGGPSQAEQTNVIELNEIATAGQGTGSYHTVKKSGLTWNFGDKVVDRELFSKSGILKVGDEEYPTTKGLVYLMFHTNVTEDQFTYEDANLYDEICGIAFPGKRLHSKNGKRDVIAKVISEGPTVESPVEVPSQGSSSGTQPNIPESPRKPPPSDSGIGSSGHGIEVTGSGTHEPVSEHRLKLIIGELRAGNRSRELVNEGRNIAGELFRSEKISAPHFQSYMKFF